MSNKANTVLHIGVTDDVQRRAKEHKESTIGNSNPLDAMAGGNKNMKPWKKVQLFKKRIQHGKIYL